MTKIRISKSELAYAVGVRPDGEIEAIWQRLTAVPRSIHAYFTAQLGEDPLDVTLYDLPVNSSCGDDCKAVIDAAAAYLRIADGSPKVRDPMLESVRRTISIFWHG